MTEGETVRLVKYVSMYTERECPAYALHTTIKEEVDHFMEDGLETELRFHENVYDAMWEEADVCFEGDPELNRAVRFNIFRPDEYRKRDGRPGERRSKASDRRRIRRTCVLGY